MPTATVAVLYVHRSPHHPDWIYDVEAILDYMLFGYWIWCLCNHTKIPEQKDRLQCTNAVDAIGNSRHRHDPKCVVGAAGTPGVPYHFKRDKPHKTENRKDSQIYDIFCIVHFFYP